MGCKGLHCDGCGGHGSGGISGLALLVIAAIVVITAKAHAIERAASALLEIMIITVAGLAIGALIIGGTVIIVRRHDGKASRSSVPAPRVTVLRGSVIDPPGLRAHGQTKELTPAERQAQNALTSKIPRPRGMR